LYNIEFVNKTFNDLPLEMKVESPADAIFMKPDGKPIIVPAEGMLKTIGFLKIPADKITQSKSIVYLGVYENGRLIEKIKVKFIGPITTFKKIKL
jgi:hypothetical protein